jgi:methionine-rich copper-binding protein CopC
MMSATKWFTTSVLLALTATAHAHAHLTDSDPSDGSTTQAPEHIVLTFSEPARLTAVTLQKDGGEVRKLAPLPTTMAARITLPLPRIEPGKYTLSWRVVGDDGHLTSGALHFTVVESAARAGGRKGDGGAS